MDPDIRFINELRDCDISGHADELIRFMLGEMPRLRKKVDHLLYGGFRCHS